MCDLGFAGACIAYLVWSRFVVSQHLLNGDGCDGYRPPRGWGWRGRDGERRADLEDAAVRRRP